MNSEVYGGFSGRCRLKIAVPAVGLMLAASLAFGEASAWARQNAGPDLKLAALGLVAGGNGAAGSAAPANPSDPAKDAETEQARLERQRLFGALDQWMGQTLVSYNYDIDSLGDPFLPIKDVRGADSGKVTPSAFTQLKLVAITKRADGSAFWASFEDGAGLSHILRPGDYYGPKKERVVKISDSAVTIEEPAAEPGGAVRISEIRLLVQGQEGLTRSSEAQVEEAGSGPEPE